MIPVRCRCGHNPARHELPGFDGECVADGCRCTEYRPVDTQTPADAPAPPSSAAAGRAPVTVAQPSRAAVAGAPADLLIAAGKQSPRKGTVSLADRIEAHLVELRRRVFDERASAEERRRKQTCSYCSRGFTTAQGRSLHERRAHEGFDPHAKNATTTERTSP